MIKFLFNVMKSGQYSEIRSERRQLNVKIFRTLVNNLNMHGLSKMNKKIMKVKNKEDNSRKNGTRF